MKFFLMMLVLFCVVGCEPECPCEQMCECPDVGVCDCDPYECMGDSYAFFSMYFTDCLALSETAKEWTAHCGLVGSGNCARVYWWRGYALNECNVAHAELRDMIVAGDCTDIRPDLSNDGVYHGECVPVPLGSVVDY